MFHETFNTYIYTAVSFMLTTFALQSLVTEKRVESVQHLGSLFAQRSKPFNPPTLSCLTDLFGLFTCLTSSTQWVVLRSILLNRYIKVIANCNNEL